MFSIYFSIFFIPLFGFASVTLEQVLVTCFCYVQVVGWILNKLGDKWWTGHLTRFIFTFEHDIYIYKRRSN